MAERDRFSRHLPALDGIRGLAIAMVMALHFVGETAFAGAGGKRFLQVAALGGYGVDLFFVLSGFLITGILADTRDSPRYFRDFYARRALRIFPLYYGVLLFVLLVVPVLGFESDELDDMRRNQAWLWLYSINFFQAWQDRLLPYVSHFWSLAVEEHFYLVWPLVVRLVPPHRLLRVCAGLAIASAALRAALAAAGVDTIALHMMTFTRLDGLCTGACLALLVRTRTEPVARLRRVGVGLAIAGAIGTVATMIPALANVALPSAVAARPSFVVLLLAALLAHGVTSDTGSLHRLLTARTMRALGKYSYGLYVFHPFIADYMLHSGTLASVAAWVPGTAAAVIAQAGFGVALSVALAVASYHGYERRFLVLKERFRTDLPHRRLALGPIDTVGGRQ